MTRRLALAVALALTTVVTFALVAIGAQAGLFSPGQDGSPVEAQGGEQTTPTPTTEPTVVTDFMFIDETANPDSGSVPSDVNSGSSPDSDSSSGDVSESDDDHSQIEEHDDPSSDDHEADEHEEEDD